MWWKILTAVLVIYTVIAGFLNEVPHLPILNETVRNLYFHVPMWFGMTVLLFISAFFSAKYLIQPSSKTDNHAVEAANTGIVFGILGLLTGMIWARFTWGAFWVGDPKLNAAAIGELIYFAYIVLRGSFSDDQQRARISAIYNLFAFPIFVALVYVLPRLTDSLHPGNGGNPGFNTYDLDNNMRRVFYPAALGFIFLGIWIASLRARVKNLQDRLNGIK